MPNSPRLSDDRTPNKSRRATVTTVSTMGSSFRGKSSRAPSTASEKTQSQWEYLMRKFSMDTKRSDFKCTFAASAIETCQTRPLKRFNTGSTYEGTWDSFGMCGFGTYTFPNGVVYKGEFENNVFHGDGQLLYADGTTVRGKWDRGELVESTVVFADGVHYKNEGWEYCIAPDRRFASEYYDGIQPTGRSYMTEPHPPIKIPPGHYDAGDGFFDPVTDLVYRYNNPSVVVRSIRDAKQWVLDNCRTAEDGPVGPGHNIYETWLKPDLNPPYPPTPRVLSEEVSSNESLFYVNQAISGSSVFQLQQRMTETSSWIKTGSFFNYDPEESEAPNKPRGRSRSQSRAASRAASRVPSRSASVATALGFEPPIFNL